MHKNMEAEIATIFVRSINKMGLAMFKKSSFFGSNERLKEERRAA